MVITFKEVEAKKHICQRGQKVARKIFNDRKSIRITEKNILEAAELVNSVFENSLNWAIGKILFELLWTKVSFDVANKFSEEHAWATTNKKTLFKAARKGGLEIPVK